TLRARKVRANPCTIGHRWPAPHEVLATHLSPGPYFLVAAGVAATQAPLPSLPPFSSHFILAFSQSALLVGVAAGVCCANAVGASTSTATTAAIGNSFMWVLPLLASFGEREVLLARTRAWWKLSAALNHSRRMHSFAAHGRWGVHELSRG